MIAVVLLYVGAVLLLNGLWLLGRIGNREISVINFFTGGVAFLIAITAILRTSPSAIGALDIQFGGFVLLFAFTYLWVGINQWMGPEADGRGLGWYSLFVAITAVPTAIITLGTSRGHPWPIWLGIDWAVWAILWFIYFLLLAVKLPITRLAGIATILVAIGTAWVPSYLLLTGYLPGI